MQPSIVQITPVNRAFIEGQGILKGIGSRLRKKKNIKTLGLKKKTKK